MKNTENNSTDTLESDAIVRKSKLSRWVQNKFMPVEEMASHARLTSRMFNAVLGNESSNRTETFEEAVRRQNLTTDDLLAAYKRQKIITITLLLIIMIGLIYILILVSNAENFADYFISAMALGPISVLGAAAIRSSFRAWQIRNRTLGKLHEYLNNYSEWWPKKISTDIFIEMNAPKKPNSSTLNRKSRKRLSSPT